MAPERQRQVDAVWNKSAAWKPVFQVKLSRIMVESFFNDDDYEEVRIYLTDKYGKVGS
jgi:hypothetical protein